MAGTLLRWQRTTRAAVGLLTRLPLRVGAADGGAAAFALVGGALGAVAALPAVALAHAAPLLAAALAVALVAVASGGLHLDGFADTLDALAAPSAERAEVARRDPSIGAVAAAGTSLLLIAQVGSLAAIPASSLAAALAVAGAASRGVPVLFAPFALRRPTGFGAWWAGTVRRRDALACLATTVGLAGILGPTHLAAAAAALSAGIGVLLGLARRFGATGGDSYGAAIEVAFLTAVATEAVLR